MSKTEVRHMCREPHCRSKLPSPTGNPRDAFCARGCFNRFYLTRCLVCEQVMPRNAGHQKVCHRAKCKGAWRLKLVTSRFLGTRTIPDITPLRSEPLSGLRERDSSGRAWHVVAGSISPVAFHCATVPDGPGCKWVGGSYERIEAENRRALKAHFAEQARKEQAEIEANGYEPEWREVISPDGVKCFVTRFDAEVVVPPILPDDLSIPDFLRRAPAIPSPRTAGYRRYATPVLKPEA